MDAVRLGLSIRALRRRRGWTQAAIAKAAGLSQPAVSRLERGEAALTTLACLERVTAVLAARLDVRVLWQGEQLDRLLDERHAQLVEAVVDLLRACGWEVVPEATFAMGGERGSVDVLAWRPGASSLVVIEVKSVVPDLQAMFAAMDRKLRLARRVAADRGWAATTISSILVLPEDRTARRRVTDHRATFDSRLPDRTVRLRQWVVAPVGAVHGVWFLTTSHGTNARHRVAGRSGRVVQARRPTS